LAVGNSPLARFFPPGFLLPSLCVRAVLFLSVADDFARFFFLPGHFLWPWTYSLFISNVLEASGFCSRLTSRARRLSFSCFSFCAQWFIEYFKGLPRNGTLSGALLYLFQTFAPSSFDPVFIPHPLEYPAFPSPFASCWVC